jgi:tRNA A37 methylthiotransferase MiaB
MTKKTELSFIITPNESFPKVIKEGEGGGEKIPHIEIFSTISYLKKEASCTIDYYNFPLLFSEKPALYNYLINSCSEHNKERLELTELMSKFIKNKDFFIFYIPLWAENLRISALLAKTIKSKYPGTKIIFLGPCCKLYPNEIFHEFSFIDYIVTSEPEKTIADLVMNKPIEKIHNIAHLRDNIVCKHKENGLNLQGAIHNLCYSEYFNFLSRYKLSRPLFLYFETSRGCKYNCFFCSLLTARNLRYKKIDFAINELKEIIKETDIRNFYFVDNEMNFDNAYLDAFLDRIINSKLMITWSSYMVAKKLNAKTIKKMRHAGCIHIRWGIESVNPDKQKTISKNLNPKEVSDILHSAHKNSIKNQIAFTLGYPYDCENDVNLTLDFIQKNYRNLDCVNLYRFKPRRNSVIFRQPEKFGIEILSRLDSLWRDEVPFNETKGLDWHLKKEQQLYYCDIINKQIKKFNLLNIDPEIYFNYLLKKNYFK